jgi:hypothetical protein
MFGQNALLLNCWIFGDAFNQVFPVQIEMNMTVGVLKTVIKNALATQTRPLEAF